MVWRSIRGLGDQLDANPNSLRRGPGEAGKMEHQHEETKTERQRQGTITRRDVLNAATGLGVAVGVGGLAAGTVSAKPQATDCRPEDRPNPGIGGYVAPEHYEDELFDGFWCNMDLVGQNKINNRGQFGQVAFSDHDNVAYASWRGPPDDEQAGTAVLNVSDPTNPRIVEMLRTPAMRQAYAGLYTQAGRLVGAREDSDELDVYDISRNPRDPRLLSTTTTATHNHDGWLTPDGETWITASFDADMSFKDLSDPENPETILTWHPTDLPAEDFEKVEGMAHIHDVTTNNDSTRLYMSVADCVFTGCGEANGLLILDSSDIAGRRDDPELEFVSFLSWEEINPETNTGHVHTSEYFIHENGREYVATTDEGPALLEAFDFFPGGICDQRGYARLIDITDEENPKQVSTWELEINEPENCDEVEGPFGIYPHYLGFDNRQQGRLIFYASYWGGVRAVDYRDPTDPVEVAYFMAPANPDIASSPGGVDRSPPNIYYDERSCHLYTGWWDNGLMVLELTDPEYRLKSCRRQPGKGGHS